MSLPEGQDTQIWATTTKGLASFHATTGQPIKTMAMSDEPRTISIPPGQTAYVTTQDGTIRAIDTRNYHSVIIMQGGSYGPMDFDELTGELYVPDLLKKQLLILSPVNAWLFPYARTGAQHPLQHKSYICRHYKRWAARLRLAPERTRQHARSPRQTDHHNDSNPGLPQLHHHRSLSAARPHQCARSHSIRHTRKYPGLRINCHHDRRTNHLFPVQPP